MKALKINEAVNLKTGLSIPSGSVVLVGPATADPSTRSIIDGVQKIPCNITAIVYTSLTAYNNGASPVDGNSISDFDPAMMGLKLSVVGYETLPTESLLIGVIAQTLEAVYPTKIEEITI